MAAAIDLTPWGFTPTESLIYEVLLRGGPGTGYTVARTAGLARANVYSALESLVAKGAARAGDGRPRQYRPEPPTILLARLHSLQGEALDRLSTALATLAAPDTPTVVEITTSRGAVQLMGREIARTGQSVDLIAPPDGCLALAPYLRHAASVGATVAVASTGEVPLGVTAVQVLTEPDWPGEPVLLIVDARAALIGARRGEQFTGHWGTSPPFVAAARHASAALRSGR